MSQQDLDTLRKYQAQADRIVEALFEAGSEKDDKCQRIAFMGGTYPLNETMLGGSGRTALKAWLTEQLMAVQS